MAQLGWWVHTLYSYCSRFSRPTFHLLSIFEKHFLFCLVVTQAEENMKRKQCEIKFDLLDNHHSHRSWFCRKPWKNSCCSEYVCFRFSTIIFNVNTWISDYKIECYFCFKQDRNIYKWSSERVTIMWQMYIFLILI